MADIRFEYTLGGDETTIDSKIRYNIYNYGALYLAMGSDESNPNITITGGVATIDITVPDGATYNFTIAEVDEAGNIGPVSNIKAITTSVSLMPIMTNFEVKDASRTKIHFDTPLGSVVGVDHNDFIIEGSVITGINTDDNYFTISSSLTWVDNRLIRKEAGNSDGCHDFNIQQIQNSIVEPSVSTIRWASPLGSGTKDGTSEANAWAASQIAGGVSAGTRVKLLAGTYSTTLTLNSAEGTLTNPIIYEGYNNASKDVLRTRTYGMTFDDSIMPVFYNARIVTKKDYQIFRNIQVQYPDSTATELFDLERSFGVKLYNCYTKGGSHGIYQFDNGDSGGGNTIVDRCYAQDHTASGIRTRNGGNYIYDSWSVSTKVINMDYYISVSGGLNGKNNSVNNCYIRRFNGETHNGHGISFKANNDDATSILEYSLAENNHIIDNRGGVEFRHSQTRYCVARNNVMEGVDESVKVIGTHFRDGASYNTFERNLVKNGNMGVRFHNAGEDATTDGAKGGFNNTVRNNVFDTMLNFVTADSGTSSNDNNFYHNTILDVDDITNVTTTFTGNIFKNNIVEGGATTDNSGTWKNTVFWNNSFASYGDTYVDIDPQLNASYEPQATFTSIDVARIDGVYYDKDGNERNETLTTVGAINHANEDV